MMDRLVGSMTVLCVLLAVALVLVAACDKPMTDPTLKPGDRVSPVFVLDAGTGKCVELRGGGEGFRMYAAPDILCHPTRP